VVDSELYCAYQRLAGSLDLINDKLSRAECQEPDGIRERGVQGALIIQTPQRPSAELTLDQCCLACLAGAESHRTPDSDHTERRSPVIQFAAYRRACAGDDGRQLLAG
jgi:hypothetical protein